MNFDEIIAVTASWIEATDDILGYEIDLYDSLYPLGKIANKNDRGEARKSEDSKMQTEWQCPWFKNVTMENWGLILPPMTKILSPFVL
jgi:hypothetical protein